MEIRKWMTHPVRVLRPKDSVAHARELMETHRLNQLPVTVDGRVVGIVTDRDVRDAFPSVFEPAPRRGRNPKGQGANPETILVESVMTANVLTLAPSDHVAKAAQLMRKERIGAVPIVEGNRLVGILTRSDVLNAFVALEESTNAL